MGAISAASLLLAHQASTEDGNDAANANNSVETGEERFLRVGGAAGKRTAALDGLALRATWTCACDEVLDGAADGHEGEGEDSDDGLELHFGF